MNPKTWAAINAGRLAGLASRISRRGGGTAVAGLVGLRFDPGLVRRLAAQLGRGSAIVTGTNGKTTTARMLGAIAREAGRRVLANPSGSNLMRGIATALLDETNLLGRIRNARGRLGVFEVDEATVPEAARELQPKVIVFTNLFRDQLDRYGEVDTVANRWLETLSDLPASTTIVLNADDPAVASLADAAPGQVLTYGIEDTSIASDAELGLEHASDYRFCLSCGRELSYEATFYGHAGHWRCEPCDQERGTPDVRASHVELLQDSSVLTLRHADGELAVEVPLAGLYNVQNALAAAAGALALGLPAGAIESALGAFEPAFGRQERFDVDGREVQVLLTKNPTGLNQVLRTVISGSNRPQHFLMLLNDGIADGRDISWIWDADYELIAGCAGSVFVSGTRAEELALRLKYADLPVAPRLERETDLALETAIDATPEGATLYVIPTYTAMLDVRELLAKRGSKQPFWANAR